MSTEPLDGISDPRRLLEGLFEHAPVAYQVYRADGHCLLVNEAFRRLFGAEPPPEYNVFEDDILAKQGFLALVRRAFEGETVEVPPHWYDPRELHQVTIREGNRVGISVTLFPLRGRDGSVEHVALCFKDVTAELLREQASAEIRRLNENLEQLVEERTAQLVSANRELESWSFSIAHDLRTPLRGMNRFARILLDDHAARLDAEAVEHLHRIEQNAILMGELIDALLSLARVSHAELQPRSTDLSALAHTVVAGLSSSEPRRDIELVIAEGLRAQADPSLARTLLENLIGNAWKFTAKQARPRIEVGATPDALFVRDNGAGFDMAYSDKLFVPFQRLHAARDFPGTGIGLATVRRIVERHNGRVWAEAALGDGATFFFTLPPDQPR